MNGWRTYEERDKCSVDALHIQLQARMGMTFDLPDPNHRPILNCRVFERDGVITNAGLIEAQAELMLLGETPLTARELDDLNTTFVEVCAAYRIKMVRSFVPAMALKAKTTRGSAIERLLKRFGFVREDPAQIVTFTRQL